MKVDIKKKEKSIVGLTIEVSKEDLKNFEKKAYQKLSSQVKVSGFRQGKAPVELIKKEVGDNRFNQEILETAISQSYYKAIIENKLLPLGSPEVQLKKFVPGEVLAYEAKIAVVPEIEIGDYKKIKLKKPKKSEVKKEEIEKTLKNLQKQYAEYKIVERSAKEGDRVEIDFDAFLGNIPIEKGSSKNHPLVIGDKVFVPGFEEKLVGMKKGKEKEFELTFPKDYYKKDLASKNVKFKVKLNELFETKLPRIDDEFAKKVSPFKNLKELKENIEKNILLSKEEEKKKQLENELLEKLIKLVKVDVPEVLVSQEMQRMVEDLKINLSRSGLTLEKYLEDIKKSQNQLETDLKPEAEKRIKLGLALNKIAELEELKVTEDEVNQTIKERALNFPDSQEAKEEMQKEETIKEIRSYLLTQKTISKLLSYALE